MASMIGYRGPFGKASGKSYHGREMDYHEIEYLKKNEHAVVGKSTEPICRLQTEPHGAQHLKVPFSSFSLQLVTMT